MYDVINLQPSSSRSIVIDWFSNCERELYSLVIALLLTTPLYFVESVIIYKLHTHISIVNPYVWSGLLQQEEERMRRN